MACAGNLNGHKGPSGWGTRESEFSPVG
jgi:hypothetical protein